MLFFNAKAQSARTGSKLISSFRIGRRCTPARFFRFILSVSLFGVPFYSLASLPELQVDQQRATAGYYQLSWDSKDSTGSTYILEESTGDPLTARVIYRGSDTATVISGKPDGVYQYRLRSPQGGSTSNAVTVTVEHHPLSTAFNFFLVGAVVFVFILAAILGGNREQA